MKSYDLLKHHTKSIEELFVKAVNEVHAAHKHKAGSESKKVAQRNEVLEALRKWKKTDMPYLYLVNKIEDIFIDDL